VLFLQDYALSVIIFTNTSGLIISFKAVIINPSISSGKYISAHPPIISTGITIRKNQMKKYKNKKIFYFLLLKQCCFVMKFLVFIIIEITKNNNFDFYIINLIHYQSKISLKVASKKLKFV